MTKKSKVQAREGSRRAGEPSWFDRLTPAKRDLLCIAGIYAIVLIVFNQIIFGNMVFSDSGDTAAAQAWFKAMEHIDQVEHVEPIWIPYIFGGMPIFGAFIFPREVNYIQQYVVLPVAKALFFGIEMHWMVMPFLIIGATMFFLCRQLKFPHLPSMLAAVTFMLNPYAIGLPETGHGSKLVVLGYIPLLFLLTHNLFQRRDLLSIGLLAASVGTMLLCRHPQMAFYGLLVIGCYLLYELALDAREQPRAAAKKAALFVLALGIGFALWAYQLFPTQEYGQYSIRGGGEIGAPGGLSYDYATNWSFHPFELLSYLVPGFFGLPDQYWGWMPFTNSILYIGLVPLFLGIIALVYRRNRMTWFLALISALFFLLSFGKHFGLLYNLMFNYFPFFNKFRTPVMILHLVPFTFGILAAYGFTAFSDMIQQSKEPELLRLSNRFRNLTVILGALLLIGLIFNDSVYTFFSSFMFQKEGELAELKARYGPQAQQALAQFKRMRFDVLWKDYIKFAVIGGATLGLVIAYLRRKIGTTTLGMCLLVILFIDLVVIDTKYINPKPANGVAEYFGQDPTIQKLQAERDTSLFRVYPVGQLDQQDRGNIMMYSLLESVQGYSPAKLKIYQEMRDSCLDRGNLNVINMLNVKYLVGDQRMQDGTARLVTQLNPGFLARAWFVDSVVVSRSKEQTFRILNSPSWNPATTAILEKDLPSKPSTSRADGVAVPNYTSREISLKTNTAGTALLVISEIYYPAGWRAFIDGTETEIYKTNYILRSVLVPPGNHEVQLRFDPPVYYLGYTLTQGAWGLVVLLILAGLLRKPSVMRKLGLKGKPATPDQVPKPG
jgi:membrane protein YfhO